MTSVSGVASLWSAGSEGTALFEGSMFEGPVLEDPVLEDPVFEGPVFEVVVAGDRSPALSRGGGSTNSAIDAPPDHGRETGERAPLPRTHKHAVFQRSYSVIAPEPSPRRPANPFAAKQPTTRTGRPAGGERSCHRHVITFTSNPPSYTGSIRELVRKR
jgi:hypothetical protein